MQLNKRAFSYMMDPAHEHAETPQIYRNLFQIKSMYLYGIAFEENI